MSHTEFISRIKQQKTENTFVLFKYIPETGERVEYKKAFSYCLIGRQSECNISLSSDLCSRYHSIIYFNDDVLNVTDLDSRQGTFVVDFQKGKEMSCERVTPFAEQQLKTGDVIKIVNDFFEVGLIDIPQSGQKEITIEK